MASKENNPGHFVPRAEFNKKFGKVELALFGSNGRGGMVKDISDLTNDMKAVRKTLKEEKTNRKQKAELSNKWKITVYGSIIGVCGLVVVEIIKLAAQTIA